MTAAGIFILFAASVLVPLAIGRRVILHRPAPPPSPSYRSPPDIEAYLRQRKRDSNDWAISWLEVIFLLFAVLSAVFALLAR